MSDRENTLAEIEVRELLEGKRIMLSMTFHEASKVLLAELDREREESRKLREDIERIIEILKNGQPAHWQIFKIRQLLEVPLE